MGTGPRGQPANSGRSLGQGDLFGTISLNGVVTTSWFAYAGGGQKDGLSLLSIPVRFGRNSVRFGGNDGNRRICGQSEETVNSASCAKRLNLRGGRSSVGQSAALLDLAL